MAAQGEGSGIGESASLKRPAEDEPGEELRDPSQWIYSSALTQLPLIPIESPGMRINARV